MLSDLVVVGSASGLVLAALVIRHHLWFMASWALTVVAFAVFYDSLSPRPVDYWLGLTGLVLLGPGLLGIRVVLVRSVSVALLRGDIDESAATLRIAERAREVVRLGLAVETERGLTLTRSGRLLGQLMHVLYSILRPHA